MTNSDEMRKLEMSEHQKCAEPQSSQSSQLLFFPQTPQTARKVSATAAKLAFRSAANNPKSRTGRHLMEFSKKITQNLKKCETEETEETESIHSSDGNIIKELANQILNNKVNVNIENPVLSDISLMADKNVKNEAKILITMNGEKKMYSKNNKKDSEVIRMDKKSPINVKNKTPQQLFERNSSSPKSSKSIEVSEPLIDKIESLDWDHLTVEVRKLNFSYNKSKKVKPLMNEVNVSIPKCSIYGLLGPSGCGKTTLLRLILGQLKPTSGSVKVNGIKPGNSKATVPGVGVGFMPQEIALYEEFAINEVLKYFGRIYGMKKDKTKSRIKFLIDFLDLPEAKRRIRTLSGGQKRRVSFAVALIHCPPLLILDEPTVGTDPLLRERIWEHLAVLSSEESITIIITTHYIEEARRAHIISLMRNGELLTENSPNFLLNHFNVKNLEEVFLKVCRNQESNIEYEMPKNYFDSRPVNKLNKPEMNCLVNNNSTQDMVNSNKCLIEENKEENSSNRCDKLLALITKNYVRVIRNKPLLAFQIVLPTICIILFCLCIGIEPHSLKIAVYNEELINSDYNNTGKYSIRYLQQIDDQIVILKSFDTKASAIESVKKSETFGAIVFSENFTNSLLSRIWKMSNFSASDDDINMSTIEFYGDLSDLIIAQTITRVLIESELQLQRVLIKSFMPINGSSKLNPRTVDPIVKFVDPPIYGALHPSYRDFMAPGIILAVTYILAVGLTALSLVIERKEGLFERTLVSGIKNYEIIIAQAVIQLAILIIQTLLVVIFTFIVFGISNNGSYIFTVCMILLQGMTGMSFGLVISTLCRDEQSAIMLSLGSFYPYMILSGIIWPLEGMPFGLRQFSYFLPQTLPIMALRNIMLKGLGISETYVWLGFISTTTWFILFIIIAIIISRIKK